MENLILRIFIQHIDGGEISYLYNRESFNLLQIDKQPYYDTQSIEVGQELQYGEINYIVESVDFTMFNELQVMEHNFGINIYSPTEPTNFNCQVNVFVRNA